jgi:FMN reductase
MTEPSIVGVSGSVTRPSRTTALVQAILDRIQARSGVVPKLIELVDSAPHLFTALTPDKLAGEAKGLIETVEQADLLVIGTPVYRASYTGALKHPVETDFLDYRVSSQKILDRANRAVAEALTQLDRRRTNSGERLGRRAASA